MTLASYFLSHLALRRTIVDVDTAMLNKNTEEIYNDRAGGNFSVVTAWLNAGGGILFFVGVILTAIFVWLNFGG